MNTPFFNLLDPNNNDVPVGGTSVLLFCINWDRESDFNPLDPNTLLFKIDIDPIVSAAKSQFRLRKQFDPTCELDNIFHLKIIVTEGRLRKAFEFKHQFRPRQFRNNIEIDIGIGKLSP